MMESPVIVENCANFATPVQTGFPFDDSDYDRDDHFEARLNDIAQRHPEFADHLRFPSLRRKRYGSGSSQDQEENKKAGASSSNAHFSSEGRRFGEHSFPSGFNRFPFTRHFEEFANEPRRDDKPPEVPKSQDRRSRKPNPYLPQHLSNTVDLGQKQTPVAEKRSQRSMSAPPENRSAQNVSSVHVHADPLNTPQQASDADMGKSFSKQGQPEAQSARGRERIIPIHVEGRDDPVIPKNAHTTHAAPEKVFGGERVHHPTFQQYSQPNQFPRQHQSHFPKHSFYEPFADTAPAAGKHFQQPPFTKQATPPSQHAHAREPSPAPPTAASHPPQQHQQQQQHTQHAAPSPPQPPIFNDPLEKIKSIRNDVMELMNQVEKFGGTKKDRQYLYLDEMLTRNLLKLDNIETEGKENIRQARKEAIKCIQTCINKLEAQAQEMEKKVAQQNTEIEPVNPTEASKTESEAAKGDQETKMEAEEAPSKQMFKSEATIVISGGAGADGDKPSQDTVTASMETEPAATAAAAVSASAGQASAPMEAELVAAAASEATLPADVPLEHAKQDAPADTSTDSRSDPTPSSQSSESAPPPPQK